jgi:hypothetical protein
MIPNFLGVQFAPRETNIKAFAVASLLVAQNPEKNLATKSE